MFFLSKEARRICLKFPELKTMPIAVRIATDQAVMNFSENVISKMLEMSTISQIANMPAVMPDSPVVKLKDFRQSYEYLTEEFVTHDYSRIDLIKMATAIGQYEFAVIKKLGDKCKQLKHFNIPYLVTVLDNEASELIEEIRREARIEQKAFATRAVELPDLRPSNAQERMEQLEQERRIDDALRGK